MKNESKLSRKNFLKKIGAFGTVFAVSKPLNALTKILSDATENEFKILDFAHITDVHITDGTNPLRVEVLDNIPGLDASWRPQQHMSATALDAVMSSINQENVQSPVDFMISTGDQVDNAMANEFQWFMDVADGNDMADDYNDLVAQDIMTSVNPIGLDSDIPWYSAIGNHDTMIVGNFPARLMEVIHSKMEEKYGFEITSQEEVIEILYGHGFENMPDNMDGYYSFAPNDYARCIVLNTNNDNWIEGIVDRFFSRMRWTISRIVRRTRFIGEKRVLKYIFTTFLKWLENQTHEVIGGIAEGTLDRDQFSWMKNEIEKNSDKLCLIFSHHGPDAFLSPIGNVTPNELKSALCSYDNVIAHLYGHSHQNLIIKEKNTSGSYWSISTCSIIEYPQEWRRISIWDNGDGTGILSCRMFQHGYTESIDASKDDPQADIDAYVGRIEDRDVDLQFEMPATVAEFITNTNEQQGDVTEGHNISSNNSPMAFLRAFFMFLFGWR